MVELLKFTKTWYSKGTYSPGTQLLAQGTGMMKRPQSAEVYQQHGFSSHPPKSAFGLAIPIGKGRKFLAIFSVVNYDMAVVVAQGGSALFSTDADGKVLKGKVECRPDGLIRIHNETKSLKTILAAQNQALMTFATAAASAGSWGQLNAAGSALSSALTTYALDIAQLLKE